MSCSKLEDEDLLSSVERSNGILLLREVQNILQSVLNLFFWTTSAVGVDEEDNSSRKAGKWGPPAHLSLQLVII